MLVAWTLLVGCQQDLLLALGDPTGIDLPRVDSSALPEGTLSPSAILIRPNDAPAPSPSPSGAPSPAADAAQPPDAATGSAPPPAPTFNPISIPEDAPENTGVRWEGVKQKGQGRSPSSTRYDKNGKPID